MSSPGAPRTVAPAAPPARGAAPPAAARGAVLAGLAALAVGHLSIDCFTGIWPVYKTIAGLDLVRAGLIATVAAVLASSLQIVFGILADRGLAKILLLAGVLGAGAVALLPYTTSYGGYFALVAVTSLASAAFHPTGTGAAGVLTRRRTGLFVALFLVGGYFGYGLSQIVFTAVYRATGGHTAVLLAVPLVAAVGIARYVPRSAVRPLSLGAWARGIHGVSGRLWRLFAIQVCAATVNVALVFLLPDLLAARAAPRWLVEGGGHLGLVIGSAIALLPAGLASDRFGSRAVLLTANVGAGVALLGVLGAGPRAAVLLPLVAAFGACNSCNSVVILAEGNRLIAGQASGVSALLMGLPWCFSAFAPFVAASLAEPAHGGTPAAALRWLALIVPVTLALCLGLPRGRRVAAA